MTLQNLTTDTIATSLFPAVNLGTGDDAIVQTGVFVSAAGDHAIRGNGDYHRVTVLGTVSADNWAGVSLGTTAGNTGQDLYIGATGVVQSANYVAVYLTGSGTVFTNHGAVRGEDAGVALLANSGTSHVFNTGTIDGSYSGLSLFGSAQASVVNTGTIHGEKYSVYGNAGAVTLINKGTLVGDVRLSTAADSYDGRGGFVVGDILGNDGNDVFIPGLGEENIYGGNGIDTVDFRRAGAISVALDESGVNGGTASGDVYTSIENLFGSSRGSDRLVGDAAANTIRGFGGADSIWGGNGGDYLFGGSGLDVLTGGAGNDQFCFSSLADCGDTIQDFGKVSGNDDGFRISAAGFGGGLSAGSLSSARFQSRADNHAQDSNDRFIFRTTDKTLWFDANGSASGGLTLVADLQANASVTYHDILLV